MEAKALPSPAVEDTVDRLESLLFRSQADGAAVEIRELEDGRQAIVIVKPEACQSAAKLAAKALPAPCEGSQGPIEGEAAHRGGQSSEVKNQVPEAATEERLESGHSGVTIHLEWD
jgi:hypothetical protein